MIITSMKKHAERFAVATVVEVEDMPFRYGGAGINGDGSEYVNLPLSRNEGYKDRMYYLKLTDQEARGMIEALQDGLTRLEGIRANNAGRG